MWVRDVANSKFAELIPEINREYISAADFYVHRLLPDFFFPKNKDICECLCLSYGLMIQPGEFNVNPSFRSAPTVSHLTLCMRLPKPGVSKMSPPSSLLYFCDFKLGGWGGFTLLLICKSSQDQCLLCLVRVPWRKTSISIVTWPVRHGLFSLLVSSCPSFLTCEDTTKQAHPPCREPLKHALYRWC